MASVAIHRESTRRPAPPHCPVFRAGRGFRVGLERAPAQLCVDALECQPLARMLAGEGFEIGLGGQRIHTHQHLPGTYPLAFAHQDLVDDAGLRRLHDLEVAGWHQLPLRHCHHVESPEPTPADRFATK